MGSFFVPSGNDQAVKTANSRLSTVDRCAFDHSGKPDEPFTANMEDVVRGYRLGR